MKLCLEDQMIELPRRGGGTYRLDHIAYMALCNDYPDRDIEQELRKMRQWLLANPKRRKVNVYQFIVNWLNKEKKSELLHPSHKPFEVEPPKPRAPEHVVQRELEKIHRMGI